MPCLSYLFFYYQWVFFHCRPVRNTIYSFGQWLSFGMRVFLLTGKHIIKIHFIPYRSNWLLFTCWNDLSDTFTMVLVFEGHWWVYLLFSKLQNCSSKKRCPKGKQCRCFGCSWRSVFWRKRATSDSCSSISGREL